MTQSLDARMNLPTLRTIEPRDTLRQDTGTSFNGGGKFGYLRNA